MTDEVLKLAVFGQPIAHSLSPTIHAQFGAALGLNLEYGRIEAGIDELPDALQRFRQQGGLGANLTLPLKQAGLSVCQSLSERAQQAAAVNTMHWQQDHWHGDNTDGAGLLWDLQRQGINISDQRVLIMGAGGAVRGILPTLLSQQPKRIYIHNRTQSRGQDLVDSVGDKRVDVADTIRICELMPLTLLINATAAGHQDASMQDSPFDIAFSQAQQPFAYDLSYGRVAASFLLWAKKRRLSHSDGLGMLVGQAAESLQIWSGADVSDELKQRTLADIRQQI